MDEEKTVKNMVMFLGVQIIVKSKGFEDTLFSNPFLNDFIFNIFPKA